MQETRLDSVEQEAARIIQALGTLLRDSLDGFTVDNRYRAVFSVASAWCVRMSRMAEAIVILHERGLDSEAAPLRRSLMEHAATLRFVVDEPDEALRIIEYDHRRNQRLLLDSAPKGKWDLDRDGRELPPSDLDMDKPSLWDRFRNVEQVVTNHGEPIWYAFYRLECGLTHPNYLTAAVYVDEGKLDEPNVGVQWEPLQRGLGLDVTASWLLMALSQLSEIADPPRQWLDRLHEAGKRIEGLGRQRSSA